MFSRQVTDQITLRLALPFYAEPLFRLTDENRGYLRRWLPWLDAVTEVDQTRRFLVAQLDRFAKGDALCVLIFWEHELIGVAGFHTIDATNQIGTIGYWLAEAFTGRGIMTHVVQSLIDVGQQYYWLQRFEIRCAVDNHASRAIPERLGFKLEGVLQRAEKIYGRWHDMAVYALLRSPPR
ncbi:Ribosomal-protein-serine acetyltransferase [Stieleria neptunia]|uniref:Ribosomal-protein-serine acetyltransferase n=1 Tax=Stieleria neptunia TaxID=2527979 RepID=A0A518HLC1_9BACT|nr:GNAT family N-acetyltransferase [Stieleria neptunia]QDV41633.1 Ribosomal-protein-serine acetyltransferase [Stieleria neptunia]